MFTADDPLAAGSVAVAKQRTGRFLVDRREPLLVLALLVILAVVFFVPNQRTFLNFFYIPVLFGAYFFGRRCAVLSGFLSVLMVSALAYLSPGTFANPDPGCLYKWLDIAAWAGFLLVTGYCMGLLYEKKEKALTVLQEAQESLKRAYQMTYDIFENSPYGISVINRRGLVEYSNPAMRSLSGGSPENLPGGNIYGHAVCTVQGITEEIRSVFEGKRFFKGSVEFAPCGDTKPSVLNFSGLPLNEKGELKALLFVEDVTERVLAEREQKKLEMQFLQAQKMESVGRLASGVAHDFNNILSAIIGYCELTMLRLPENHRARDYIEAVKEAGERAEDLTRQLLAFSRRQVLDAVPVALNDSVETTLRMARRLLGSDIDIDLRLQPGVRTVLADPGQMEQILMNLVVNARDAMPAGGRLIIETAEAEMGGSSNGRYQGLKAGPYVVLSVSDTGVGMNDETRARIFEPFFTTKELGKGTGLGLATVYGIVKQHNGYIYVFSKEGKGTQFQIFLPPCNREMCESPDKAPAHVPGGTETVLVSEDDAPTRRWVVEAIKEMGYTVLESSNAGEALEVSERFPGPIHLLLTDVVMPRMSGKELAEQFHRKRPESKIIFMSGYPEERITHLADSHRALFLEKPLTLGGVSLKLREALDAKT